MPVRVSLLATALWWAGPASGQAPAGAPPAGDAPRAVAALSTRFRFVERYERGPEKKQPEAIDQYRVATRDVVKIMTERSPGSPERQERTRQNIYAERPARVNTAGKVEATVRHYEAYRLTPDPGARPSRPTPLEGLTLWYEPRAGQQPRVLTLSAGRGLREDEYTIAAIWEIFVPALTTVLPTTPLRKGDRWTVSQAGVIALLGMPPLKQGGTLTGTLLEVRQSAQGPNWEALLGVTGRIALPVGDTAVNARLTFAFPPPKGAEAEGEKAPVEARGAVVELRMGTTVSTPVSPNGRLRQVRTRELVLVRQLADAGEPLSVPDATPEATEQNSWLTYDDPQGRFHFRYPQEFQLGREPDEFSMELARYRPGSDRPDSLELRRVVKSGDAQADRLNRDPEMHVKVSKESWRQDGFEVIAGQHGWLPDADWAASKRKVYRAESVLRGTDPTTKREYRLSNELYFAQFGREESLVVIATTAQDPPTAFRKEVEAILRSYDFGPSPAR